MIIALPCEIIIHVTSMDTCTCLNIVPTIHHRDDKPLPSLSNYLIQLCKVSTCTYIRHYYTHYDKSIQCAHDQSSNNFAHPLRSLTVIFPSPVLSILRKATITMSTRDLLIGGWVWYGNNVNTRPHQTFHIKPVHMHRWTANKYYAWTCSLITAGIYYR